ncbi:MAG TPA: MFS transporter [Gammaproteobacteria bacterium]|nr:MFS transporter [Gammaproteobacteria bacterium]
MHAAEHKMTATERKAVFSLSAIMGLRMVGLFMVLPLFSLYAHQLVGATATLIGVAMGVYGLAQALFQIPFGYLSDKVGRKPIILMGLLIFCLGSLVAGHATHMVPMIIGRALQGIGAVGSTILAMMADLTRESQRTKSMAIAGITIGFSFSVAMFLGPVLSQWISINHLFYLAAGFGLIGILVLYFSVPTPATESWHRDAEPEFKSFFQLIFHPELAKLNIGILILHAIFTASFVVIPISLKNNLGFAAHDQWEIYLPTLLGSFIISLFCIGMAERKGQLKPYFIGGIAALLAAALLMCYFPANLSLMILGLSAFFGGFSLMEAFLPSLISRTAPADRKGSAMGVYSCSQFLGIFMGGVLGGWLYGKFSFSGVYLFCAALSLFWLVIACAMQAPRTLVTQIIRLSDAPRAKWSDWATACRAMPGMVEVIVVEEDGLAYLKMERSASRHPDFLHLKESLNNLGA